MGYNREFSVGENESCPCMGTCCHESTPPLVPILGRLVTTVPELGTEVRRGRNPSPQRDAVTYRRTPSGVWTKLVELTLVEQEPGINMQLVILVEDCEDLH